MYPAFALDLPDGAAGTAGEIDVCPRIVIKEVLLCEFGSCKSSGWVTDAMLIKFVHAVAGHLQEVRDKVSFRPVKRRFEHEAGFEIGCRVQYDEAGKVQTADAVKSELRFALHAGLRFGVVAEIPAAALGARELDRRYDRDAIWHGRNPPDCSGFEAVKTRQRGRPPPVHQRPDDRPARRPGRDRDAEEAI